MNANRRRAGGALAVRCGERDGVRAPASDVSEQRGAGSDRTGDAVAPRERRAGERAILGITPVPANVTGVSGVMIACSMAM